MSLTILRLALVRSRVRAAVLSIGIACCCTASAADPPAPQVLDSRMRLELFAAEPEIVTPTGAVFDQHGRLLVVESHTHQRPGDYQGPAADRIRIVDDTNGDGRADRFRTFFEGTEATMSLARGADDWIYVATRMKVFRIRDRDGDDRADEEETIAHLETTGRYPHNGLSGLAFDNSGRLLFGMGENLGAQYRLVGSDGAVFTGAGEGGVFRCTADGKQLARLATGFWNPFGICVDAHDRIFAVGNDPDGSPPCLLMHVVETGDYGFQFRFGRSGKHPLQAWNGELPGTLPMLAGTGEAPCELLVFRGRLWVASWGHHRIERYELLPMGASFQARREIVVQGDESFRPVAFAPAADGSLYVTDWVDRSYPVHGKGRIWRLSFTEPSSASMPPVSEAEQQAANAAAEADLDALRTDDRFLRQAAIAGLSRSAEVEAARLADFDDARQRLGVLQAIRWRREFRGGDPLPPPPLPLLKQALADADPVVRLYGVRWAADALAREVARDIQQQLRDHVPTPALWQASIAALELLDTGKSSFDPKQTARYFLDTVNDDSQPDSLRALALRMIPPEHAALDLPLLTRLLDQQNASLSREAVRTLALSPRPERFAALAAVAADENRPTPVRADAAMGLAADAQQHESILRELATSPHGDIRQAATRALDAPTKAIVADHPPPENLDAWMARLESRGNADAGWRVFFGAAGRCAGCHRFEGRGADTGPDLTGIADRMSRRRVLESILLPSREIAPQYVPSLITTTDGRVLAGIWQGYDDQTNQERFLAADGTEFRLDAAIIESRHDADVSIMPDNLHRQLSLEDIANLLALLSEGER